MIRVFEDAETLARAVAERIVHAAAEAIEESGAFRIGLSGGNTPRRLYRLLASPDFRERVDWSRTVICFADERAVAPDHPDSNFRLVREALIEPAGLVPENVHRMKGEATDLEAAARDYERVLAESLSFLLLGVGTDGHTASIFPGSPLVFEQRRRAAVVWNSPKPPPRRLTVTPRVFQEARDVAVMAAGAEKSGVVAEIIERRARAGRLPAGLLRDRDWYLDRAAAGELEAGTPHSGKE